MAVDNFKNFDAYVDSEYRNIGKYNPDLPTVLDTDIGNAQLVKPKAPNPLGNRYMFKIRTKVNICGQV